jgi:hypothetical protein
MGRSVWLLGLVSDKNAIYSNNIDEFLKNIHFFGIVYTSSACFSSEFGCWNNLPIVKSADENSLDDESGVVTTGVLGVVGSIVDGPVCLTDSPAAHFFFFSLPNDVRKLSSSSYPLEKSQNTLYG